jgi:hypothetical protein
MFEIARYSDAIITQTLCYTSMLRYVCYLHYSGDNKLLLRIAYSDDSKLLLHIKYSGTIAYKV